MMPEAEPGRSGVYRGLGKDKERRESSPAYPDGGLGLFERRYRYVTFAKWSWILPLLAWGLQAMLILLWLSRWEAPLWVTLTVGVVQLGLLVGGLILGIMAVMATSKYDRPGIVGPGTVGIVLSGVTLLFVLVLAVRLVQEMREAIRLEQERIESQR